MTLTNEDRQNLTLIGEHLPEVFTDGGQALADDLREALPDLTDVQMCRIVLALSGAVTDLIKAVEPHTGDKPVDATLVVTILDSTAMELGRIEMGCEQ